MWCGVCAGGLRGAWLWPTFVALTVVDAVLLQAVPLAAATGPRCSGRASCAGFFNLFAVAVAGARSAALLAAPAPARPAADRAATTRAPRWWSWSRCVLARSGSCTGRRVLEAERAHAARSVAAVQRLRAHAAPRRVPRARRAGRHRAHREPTCYRTCVPGGRPDARAVPVRGHVAVAARASRATRRARRTPPDSADRWSRALRARSAAAASSRQLADPREELGGVGAVEDAVVAGERDAPCMWRGTISPSRTTGRCSIAPTARIAACGGLITAVKLRDAVHAEVGDGEGAAGELGRRDRARRARARRACARVARDLPERLAVGVEDGRDDERVLAPRPRRRR